MHLCMIVMLCLFPYFSNVERRRSLFTTVIDHVRYSVVAIFDECVFVYKLPTFVKRKTKSDKAKPFNSVVGVVVASVNKTAYVSVRGCVCAKKQTKESNSHLKSRL